MDLDTLRVDNLGSLLRPAALLSAYDQHAAGDITDAELTERQDEAIREAVRLQEAHGLPVISDGEFRRRHFNESFAKVSGFASGSLAPVAPSRPPSDGPQAPSGERVATVHSQVTERIALVESAPLAEFTFTQALTDRPVKATLVNPDGVAQRYDSTGTSAEVYEDADAFLDDVVRVGREIIAGLIDAGCRYIQIDAPRYGTYLDAGAREELRSRGRDPQRALERAIEAENALIAGFEGATFGLHVCRGNRRSQWHFEGAYDEIAQQLAALDHDRLLLEYDSDRAGGFEPLRLVPEGTVVVLGLITTKTGELESAEHLKRRIDEAARHVPLEQLALSTQCGFASVAEGNLLTEDDQWRKFDRMLEVAADVWGSS
jgi:5-methyltetrahydropteroyltriglutamate--homocysteine methyltransferase